MQPRSSFDRGLLIAIAIGVVSTLGIGWIFWTSKLRESFIPPTAIPTTIPFDVNSLKTEILTFYPSATPSRDETTPTATGTNPPSKTLPSTSALITKTLPAPSATYTPAQIQPLQAGKQYDDTDPNIAYDPYWTLLKNPGTKNAFKGTIHFSTNIGDEASFRFTGKRFLLGYQRGKNFGFVTVIIDDQSYSFHEEAFDLSWLSPKLPPGDHFVRIIHETGESINLDYIVILD